MEEALQTREAAQRRWRGLLRLTLGRAQMVGAMLTLITLIQQGVGPAVIWGATLTGLLTLVSFFLFRIVWRPNGKS